MAKKRKKKKRRTRRYRKQSVTAMKLKKQTVYSVGAIWMWIIALVITLSFFGEGLLLSFLRNEITFYIGGGMYLLPPLLVVMSFLFFKVKSDIAKPHVSMGLSIISFALIALFRGGVIGSFVFDQIAIVIAAEGAVLLFLCLIVIGIIVLFNTSLDVFVDFLLTGFNELISWFVSMTKADTKKSGKFSDSSQLTIRGGNADSVNEKAPVQAPPIATKKSLSSDRDQTMKIESPKSEDAQDMSLWEYPSLDILSNGPRKKADRGDIHKNANVIEKTLEGFGVQAKVKEVNQGPAVTQYALEIALGTKVSKITSLSSDLALALAAPTGQVRIEAPIPGRSLVGIEIPNRGLEFVTLKQMLSSEIMQKNTNPLAVPLGLDVSGNPKIAEINSMPHVLIAGATGSGKSVLINSWISSLLFRSTPQQVRLILVDPKRVELTGYNNIPHLLTPVIVEVEKILSALRWAVNEMNDRYKQFADVGVRNIEGYNELSGFQSMPYVVIVIDELADLMMFAPTEVEDAVTRIAQMARAVGIHLVLATQRPSVDVLTGLIKANVPARMAFNVTSMVDSRVIIDMPGAEKLLGRGDMLFIPPDQAKPSRIQGAFVSEKDVKELVKVLKEQNVGVEYTEEVLTQKTSAVTKRGSSTDASGRDQLFEDALRLICQHDKASASLLQRRLSIGYARAARILDQLEDAGIISPAEGSKPRDVLIKNPDDFLAVEAES